MTATAPARPIGTPLVPDVRGPGVRRTWVPMGVAAVLMVVLSLVALCTGPVAVSPTQVLGTLLAHVPLLHFHTSTPAIDQAIVWQLRAPRVVLAGIVGAMLAAGGAAYQGLFRNPLADPYLLGVAAGAGLGATVEIVYGGDSSVFLPIFAFVGGSLAVAATYLIGVAGGRRAWGFSIVLAGVAVAALLTAIQTYLQQRDQEQIRQIYNWILGSFSVASWSDVTLILPYVVVSAAVLLAHRRMLDVLRVGEDEAGTLGIHPARTRVIVVAAATLGTAAAVSVSGLIGFVGIIVAHTVRLTAGASYRIILPVAMVGGGVPDRRRPDRPDRAGTGRGPDRRGHSLHRGALLPRRAGLTPRRTRHGFLMARLGTVIRLSERRGRRGAGAPEGSAMVELGAVSVRFEGRAAVDGVSASVGRGEWVGLIGANGAGKTTLLRALVGLVDHEGEVRIGGKPTTAMGRRQRARAVAYVPQAPEMPADMSVLDYTLLGRTPHIAYLAVESADDLVHCARLLERLELGELSRRHLSTLSGGERQRVVLARALAQEAPVLLMDEPTSALDLAHRVEALEIVDELRREWGLTVMSAMHDLTLAGQFADRLLLLSGGSVAAFGTPGEVLDEEVLGEAFGCTVRIIRTDDGELVVAPRRAAPRQDGSAHRHGGGDLGDEEAQ